MVDGSLTGGGIGPFVLQASVSVAITGPHMASVGSCCLVGTITEDVLYVANLSDSHAVLGRWGANGRAVVTERLSSDHSVAVLKRTKSVTPKPAGGLAVESGIMEAVDSPRKKSFWFLLSLTSCSVARGGGGGGESEREPGIIVLWEEGGEVEVDRVQQQEHFRDFLEHISTGFEDYTLRRVES